MVPSLWLQSAHACSFPNLQDSVIPGECFLAVSLLNFPPSSICLFLEVTRVDLADLHHSSQRKDTPKDSFRRDNLWVLPVSSWARAGNKFPSACLRPVAVLYPFDLWEPTAWVAKVSHMATPCFKDTNKNSGHKAWMNYPGWQPLYMLSYIFAERIKHCMYDSTGEDTWILPCAPFPFSPVKNTGVGSHSLLWGIFLTQGLNPCLLHCRQILYHMRYQGSPN